MLKAILFDMDDTLIDWSGRVQDWLEYEREHLNFLIDHLTGAGHAVPDADYFFTSVRQFASDSWVDSAASLRAPRYAEAILKAMEHIGIPLADFDEDTVLRALKWKMIAGVVAFPDVVEVLPVLVSHKLQLGLITNASTPMWLRDTELEEVGLLHYFSDCRLSAVDVGYLKPHPAIFQYALDRLQLQPSEVVFVGDNPEADVSGAQSVGMKAVLRVVQKPGIITSRLFTPDARIDTFHELPAILDEWYPGWR